MEAFLEHLKGERAGSVDRISKDVIRVGRSAEFELPFDDLGVSFEHAELRLRDGDYWLVDRGSTNGSFVNEERAYNARLKEGDVLRFGKKGPVVRFRLTTRPGDPPPRDPRRSDSDERSRSSESLSDLPPLPVATVAPVIEPRKRRATVPSMPALAQEPPPAPAVIDAPSDSAGPAASSSGTASSGGSSSSTGGTSSGSNTNERRLIIGTARTPTWIYGTLCLLSLLTVGATASALALWLELERKETLSLAERQRADQARKEVEDLRRAAAERDREEVKASQRAREDTRALVERLEQQLDHERRESRRIERESRARVDELEHSLARARSELAQRASADGRGTGDTKAWKAIQKRLQSSIVLVVTTFSLKRKDGTREPYTGVGTGFVVTRDGHVCTNKHVVEPWKFRPLAVKLATEGLEVDPASYALSIWVSGKKFLSGRSFEYGKNLEYDQGFSTLRNTLAVVRTAPDKWAQFSVPNPTGTRYLLIHADTNDDLAILKAPANAGLEPAPIRRPHERRVETFDPVMVLGFPAGAAILEKGVAEMSPSLGVVRKVEDTILTSAGSIISGNSGGPLIDSEGRVIGVATRVLGGDAMGICIKSEHVLALLDDAPW